MKKDILYSIIIPVFNGEKTLQELTDRLLISMANFNFEIIYVYDFGVDNSWNVIKSLIKQHPKVITGIHLSRNYGQHNAILCGIKESLGEFIITMDEDLQHRPEDIKLLINKQKETGVDVVYGKYNQLKHSGFRNLTSLLMKKLLKKGLPELFPDYSAFRLIKRDIGMKITEMSNSYTFLDGYLSWVTNSFDSTVVKHEERQGGKSSYTIKKLIEHSINIFVTFSDLPIRLLSKTSILIFIITVFYSLYVIVRKFVLNDFISGYPSLIISIGFGVSIIMLGLGILGEYIHRINLKTTKRPNYSIKEIIK